MDWRKKCILCDKGGNHLLVCKADDCPISVHESCMDCEARFDNAGNFYCPYCRYKRSTSEFRRVRETVMLTKQALSNFLEVEEPREGSNNHQSTVVGLVDKLKGASLMQKLADVNNPVCRDVQKRGVGLEKHQRSKVPLPCEETCDTFISVEKQAADVNTCRIMVLYKPNSNRVDAASNGCKSSEVDMVKDDQRGSGVDKKVKGGNGTRNANQQHSAASVEEEEEEEEEPVQLKSADILPSIEKQVNRKKRNNSVAFNENERSKRRKQGMMENAAEILVSLQIGSQLQSSPNGKIEPNGARKESTGTKDISIDNSGELKDSSSGRNIVHLLQQGKHRVLWSEQEEDMLKEGVQKFSSSKRKNLPWKKILDFGRHVFDPCRNPSDLKDKWRNIAKRT